LPPENEPDQLIYFAEFQAQEDEGLYERLLMEAFIYLGQYRPQRSWQAVAIWKNASLDCGVPQHYQELYGDGYL
jgi:predicted transposase YdaD